MLARRLLLRLPWWSGGGEAELVRGLDVSPEERSRALGASEALWILERETASLLRPGTLPRALGDDPIRWTPGEVSRWLRRALDARALLLIPVAHGKSAAPAGAPASAGASAAAGGGTPAAASPPPRPPPRAAQAPASASAAAEDSPVAESVIPASVDQFEQAQALIAASKDGAPFCEECARAAAAAG